MKKTAITFLCFFSCHAFSAGNGITVSINSGKDAVSYIKTAYSIGVAHSCWSNSSYNKKVNDFMSLGVPDFGNDLEIYKRVEEIALYNCTMLGEVIDMVYSNRAAIISRYPPTDNNVLKVLSVDKNSAAHNVMVGGAEKGKWVICYGLNDSGLPLAKQTSLVKSKYTLVNISSRSHHNSIVKYECEYEG